MLVGSLLGDGCAKREKSGGVRFSFKQFEANEVYIFWLHEFFNKRGYCSNNLPVLYKNADFLRHPYYSFVTYRYTSLLWLYKLFYNNRKQKRISHNISDLLTPLSLAIWICDKGANSKYGFRIINSCYTKEEVLLLSLALESKFNIKSTLHCYHGNIFIQVKPESVPLLKILLEPYFVPTMRDKLGL